MHQINLLLAQQLLLALGLEPGDNLVVRRNGSDYELDLSPVWKAQPAAPQRKSSARPVVRTRPLPGGPIPTVRLVGHDVIDDLLRDPQHNKPQASSCSWCPRLGCFTRPADTDNG